MTDQQINEAVARKLGWTDLFLSENIGVMDIAGKRMSTDTFNSTVPNYCHSIEAAWEIVEHVDYCKIVKAANAFRCEMAEIKEYADTAPMAICLAYLKLP